MVINIYCVSRGNFVSPHITFIHINTTSGIGINIFRGISHGLGFILNFIYGFVNNYGVAILLFTIIVKAILMPLTVKQQKSMLKTQKLQPLLMDLQKKY